MTGVNTCRHCSGTGTCYRASTARTFTRIFKIRFSCHSCLTEAGYVYKPEDRLIVNCNICKGSGLLPGANTFFQEYIKPKTFPQSPNDEKTKALIEGNMKMLEENGEPKALSRENTNILEENNN